MHAILLALIFLLFDMSNSQVANLSFQIMSEGQIITIPLQQYFEHAESAHIVKQKSTAGFQKIFTIDDTMPPYTQIYTQSIQYFYKGQKIKLNQTWYYTTKTLYNQPVKFFLLKNNFLMMYIYSQQCKGVCIGNQVLGLNLTDQKLTIFKGKKINCSSMQVQASYQDSVYIMCRAQQNGKKYSYFVIEVGLIHSPQGFISKIYFKKNQTIVNQIGSCIEYSMKYFDFLTVQNYNFTNSIFLYCKNAVPGAGQNHIYFNNSQSKNWTMIKDVVAQINKCLTNATYISSMDSGFLSVINNRIFQYYTNQTLRQSKCRETNLMQKNYEFLFAASRTYNSINITYFFFRNNIIIIKSSYRTNYQKLNISSSINCTGYQFSSYALTQHFMAVSLTNKLNGNTLLLVYQMEELNPRLIDSKIYENKTLGDMTVMSTSNYLQRGFYLFFYSNSTNQLTLSEYNGYLMSIYPKNEQQKLSLSRNMNFKQTKISKFSNVFPQNSTVYTIYIEQNFQNNKQKQYILINIAIRVLNSTEVNFYPLNSFTIDSRYTNFNLSKIAVGPLQRYFLQDNIEDNYIKMHFINYYNTINISSILNINGIKDNSDPPKQIVLNSQLKLLNPVFSIFYSTYIKNCILKYDKNIFQFDIDCKNSDIINFKSSIDSGINSKIMVLAKDKWLQYTTSKLQLCSIVGQSGYCELLPLSLVGQIQSIQKIKLAKFQSKISGYTQIYIFIICKVRFQFGLESHLYYGTFQRLSSLQKFKYSCFFQISSNQVNDLATMQLTNIHYDKNYKSFLLLQLLTIDKKHIALLYDRPTNANNCKFLGHLIRRFDDKKIQSVMTIDNLLIIVSRLQNGNAIINQYKITQFYSIYETRKYPLYGRKVVKNGNHNSDGEFLYIQVELQRKQEGMTQYLVFCPALNTANVLTHVIKKQSPITFIQQIGGQNNKYQHSIGINGQTLFALSVPNLMIKFEYNHKNSQYNNNYSRSKSIEKNIVKGDLNLKLVDYKNIMHEVKYLYEFDISAQSITYVGQAQQALSINSVNSTIKYALDTRKINGPVMQIDFNLEKCPFINKYVSLVDVFTKTQCLINIDSKKFGSLLDLITISRYTKQNLKSFEIIITTNFLICVQNRQIDEQNKIELPFSKDCNIISYQNDRGIFVCDEGQGSVIRMFTFTSDSCDGISITQIAKPTWLYPYFKMKFKSQYAVFQVPIRIQTNKVYFLTTFDIENLKFSQSFYSLTNDKFDNFQSRDFEMDKSYIYLLEDGLGIYDFQSTTVNETFIQPLIWISEKQILQSLKSTSQLVYIKPQFKLQQKDQYGNNECQDLNFSRIVHMQIGTLSHAYKLKICFNSQLPLQGVNNKDYMIKQLVIYKQYKDCKNNDLSKSKNYGMLTIKLCKLQVQQHRIFSNYMPIISKTSQYYMQFYSYDHQAELPQTIYPFRMEKVSTNDTFQIKQNEGELIVRSLFNFLCYYQLANQITWTFSFNDNFTNNQTQKQQNQSCNAVISLQNQNYLTTFKVIINNTNIQVDKSFMPWIFRVFFIILCCISLFKWRKYSKIKAIKMNKMTLNLLSDQFQFKVKQNSRKQIILDTIIESQSYT